MKVIDEGEVIRIEFHEGPIKKSTFPTPLTTVDHGDVSLHRPDGDPGDVIGIEFVGSAAEQLRKSIKRGRIVRGDDES